MLEVEDFFDLVRAAEGTVKWSLWTDEYVFEGEDGGRDKIIGIGVAEPVKGLAFSPLTAAIYMLHGKYYLPTNTSNDKAARLDMRQQDAYEIYKAEIDFRTGKYSSTPNKRPFYRDELIRACGLKERK